MCDPTFAAAVPGAGVSTEAVQMLNDFWPKVTTDIRALKHDHFKTQELPLARIKKIMKLDEDVKMISAEAPVLFAKAAGVFISELSLRSWIHTEDNKRRTLQRNDIAMAISKFDQFDFLIDIVPREELKPPKRQDDAMRTPVLPDQIQYYLQLAQQQAQQQAGQPAVPPAAPVQAPQPAPTQIQLSGGAVLQQSVQISQPVAQPAVSQQVITQPAVPPQAVTQQAVLQQPAATTATTQSQMITIQPPQQQQAAVQPQVQQVQQLQQPAPQVFQQVFTPSGDVQNVPIQLTPQQLQAIQMQLQGKGNNVIIQQSAGTQPSSAASQAEQAPHFNSQGVFQVEQIAGQAGQPVYIQQTDSVGGDT